MENTKFSFENDITNNVVFDSQNSMTMTQMRKSLFFFAIFAILRYFTLIEERKKYYDKRLLLFTVSLSHIRNVVAINWYEVGSNSAVSVKFNKHKKSTISCKRHPTETAPTSKNPNLCERNA